MGNWMKKPSTYILFRLGFQSPNAAALILVRLSFSILFSIGSITGALEVLLQRQEQHTINRLRMVFKLSILYRIMLILVTNCWTGQSSSLVVAISLADAFLTM